MKKLKEWFIEAPWGKIALVSWGNPGGEPVLLVHGRQDSAATFIPLLEYLPESMYYVAVDLPGHGRSDPLPTGVMLSRIHFLAGVEYAVKHLQWNRFLFVGHSMGCEQGIFFNVMYPGKVKEFILLDPIPSLQRLLIRDFTKYYKAFYEDYYKNYEKYNKDDRVYSKRQAMDAVMRARGLTEEQAEVVLSRNLWPIGEDKYRLSWDRRTKYPATKNYSLQYYYELFSQSVPPTLVLSASVHSPVAHSGDRKSVEDILARVQGAAEEYYMETIEGTHDIHLINPGLVAKSILKFINRNRKAKL